MQTQQLDEVSSQQIEKAVLMEAMVSSDMGISFLRWLCGLCDWDRSICTNNEAARRDLWITIRRFIPIEKLGSIEYEGLRQQQQRVQALIRTEMEEKPADEPLL